MNFLYSVLKHFRKNAMTWSFILYYLMPDIPIFFILLEFRALPKDQVLSALDAAPLISFDETLPNFISLSLLPLLIFVMIGVFRFCRWVIRMGILDPPSEEKKPDHL